MPTMAAHAGMKVIHQVTVELAKRSRASTVRPLTGQPLGLLVVLEYGKVPVVERPKMGQLEAGAKATSASERSRRLGVPPSSAIQRFDGMEMLLLFHGRPSMALKYAVEKDD